MRLTSLMLIVLAVFVYALQNLTLAAQKPNVVIFYTDDHGTLDAHCYGTNYLHTPNIDKLAKTGVRFIQAYAHTVCCPSRAALLTGRHPQRSGVNDWTQGDMKDPVKGVNMNLSEITLAETMKAAGYRTALFGKWHLGAHRDYGPIKQGFDEFFGIRGGFIDNNNHYFLQEDGFHDLYEGTREIWAKGNYFPEMVVDRANQFLRKNKNRPFFLYLPFNTPHYPEQPLKKHLKMYQQFEDPKRSYGAFVTTTDYYIGKVMKQLDKLQLRKNTIIIFMSDNGHQSYQKFKFFQVRVDNHKSGFPKGHRFSVGKGSNNGGGNTGKWIGNKGTFLEGGVRVPAIISYPKKLPAGQVRHQAISTMDWYPTILKLCEIKPPAAKLDGKILLSVIHSADAKSPHPTLYFQWQNNWMVRDTDWKLIRHKNKRKTAKEHFTLHHLADEKPEVTNYFSEKPEIVQRLKKKYNIWQKDVFQSSADSK